MRPSAGKMRPKTIESGILMTNRNSPVSTNMLTRMLVPKPKKALKSPAVHKRGRYSVVDVSRGHCTLPSVADPGDARSDAEPLIDRRPA